MLRVLIFLVSLGARALRAMCRCRADLVIENLALRQQVTALKKERPRLALEDVDRAFWVALRDSWPAWASRLVIVKADTVAEWNRARFRRYWTRISSTHCPGRPRLDAALLHGSEQIADLPVPVAESPGAVRIGHPERGHLVEYLAPNSVFNSLPRQRSSPHLRPDDRLVTIDRVFHHASLGAA